jgi:hypothetical protein
MIISICNRNEEKIKCTIVAVTYTAMGDKFKGRRYGSWNGVTVGDAWYRNGGQNITLTLSF